MNWSDAINNDLPSRRPDEPEALRDDIADEINDHLCCALHREQMNRDCDEQQANQQVLQKFGNPAWVARKLYFAAMKEQIMKDRIILGLMTAMVGLCALMVVFIWAAMNRAHESQQMLATELASIQDKFAQPAPSLEWGALTIRMVDAEGKPIPNWPILISGDMFSPDAPIKNHEVKTDISGQVKFDPIRTGTHYKLQSSGKGDWHIFLHDLLLYPGENKVFTIAHPPEQQGEVKFGVDWPDAWPDSKTRLECQFQADRSNLDGGNWYQGINNRVVFDDGKLVGFRWTMGADNQTVSSSWTWTLPVGRYLWTSVVLHIDGPGLIAKTRYSFDTEILNGREFPTFEIKPGQLNRINVPLTTEMIQRLEKKKRVINKK